MKGMITSKTFSHTLFDVSASIHCTLALVLDHGNDNQYHLSI
jgi:hypothetical protein